MPPVGTEKAVPVLPPKHKAAVAPVWGKMAVGEVMVTDEVWVHALASVTVTIYTAGDSPVVVAAVTPVDQL